MTLFAKAYKLRYHLVHAIPCHSSAGISPQCLVGTLLDAANNSFPSQAFRNPSSPVSLQSPSCLQLLNFLRNLLRRLPKIILLNLSNSKLRLRSSSPSNFDQLWTTLKMTHGVAPICTRPTITQPNPMVPSVITQMDMQASAKRLRQQSSMLLL